MILDESITSRVLQLLEQAEDPLNVLSNIAQLWLSDGTGTGNTGDIYAKIHQTGDPGDNVIHKLLDYSYATFFGEKLVVTAGATVAIVAGSYNTVYCALDQNVTFTITGGTEGQRLYFILKQDATGNRVVTFSTGFRSLIPKMACPSEYIIVGFVYDSNNSLWQEAFCTHRPDEKHALIIAPDAINDQVPMFHVDSSIYPSGIKIVNVQITIPADAAYSMVFEEWAGDPPAYQADIETVSTTGTDSYKEVTGSDIDNSDIDAGDYVFLDIPATDVDWILVKVIFYPKGI